jgi:hypothetical protein
VSRLGVATSPRASACSAGQSCGVGLGGFGVPEAGCRQTQAARLLYGVERRSTTRPRIVCRVASNELGRRHTYTATRDAGLIDRLQGEPKKTLRSLCRFMGPRLPAVEWKG